MHECDGRDHHLESYAAGDRRLLALVEAFDRRLIEAIDAGYDVSAVMEALDPDPARYTWVDEGGGLVEEVLRSAEEVLRSAPRLGGHERRPSLAAPSMLAASRPAVAVTPDGGRVLAWIEWVPDRGDRIVVVTLDGDGLATMEPATVQAPPSDCLRPSVTVDGEGTPWVFFGLRRNEQVGVYYSRLSGGVMHAPERLSTTPHPSFNQEVACRPDGSIECCWQGYAEGSFAIFTRRWRGGQWGETELVSSPDERNVWDPTIAIDRSGRRAYAWTSYGLDGYRTKVLVDGDGADVGGRERHLLGAPGSYCLHPSLAFAVDGSLWCAYDDVALAGHGGSGPTRLSSAEELGRRASRTRQSGAVAAGSPPAGAIPDDLAPEVRAEVRVVRLVGGAPKPETTGTVGRGQLIAPQACRASPLLATVASPSPTAACAGFPSCFITGTLSWSGTGVTRLPATAPGQISEASSPATARSKSRRLRRVTTRSSWRGRRTAGASWACRGRRVSAARSAWPAGSTTGRSSGTPSTGRAAFGSRPSRPLT